MQYTCCSLSRPRETSYMYSSRIHSVVRYLVGEGRFKSPLSSSNRTPRVQGGQAESGVSGGYKKGVIYC